jgi:hypothetical protein
MEVTSKSLSFFLVQDGEISGNIFSDSFDFSEFSGAS